MHEIIDVREESNQSVFTIVLPLREYVLVAKDESKKKIWVTALRSALEIRAIETQDIISKNSLELAKENDEIKGIAREYLEIEERKQALVNERIRRNAQKRTELRKKYNLTNDGNSSTPAYSA